MRRLIRTHTQAGFTIVEVAVVAPIMMIIVLSLLTLLSNMLQSSAAERVGAENMYNIHTAMNLIENDVSLTNTFLETSDTNMNDTYKPAGGWSFAKDGSGQSTSGIDTLILRNYATTTNPDENDREPVFINTEGCDPANLYYNDALSYNVIYFVKNATLYRRRLVDTSQSTCSPPYQEQSCPPASSTATCPADEVIATNVSQFQVDYYATSVSASALDTGTDPTLVESADSIKVTVGITQEAYTQSLTDSSAIRASKLITSQVEF